ncbi:MAG: dienelactone hydrolase family protein [Gammaproteobacteria bacterium]|nr:dienelactone hydrolase family protein [Gammaproteobacteria bacterium]
MEPEIVTLDVLGSPMETFRFTPPEGGPHPGIVLAQHIPVGHSGIENDTFTLTTAERLAQNGYAVAVPFIFHWWPKSAELAHKRDESRDDWMVADCQAAFAMLASDPNVIADKIGVVGHCWGGRVAWLAACHIPEIAACGIFYGGRIKLAMGAGNPPAIELAGQIGCHLVGFWGNEDTNPPPEDVDELSAALDAANVPHTFHRYDGAGHAFQNFPTPERYRPEASEDAWAKLLDFLAEELK